MKHDYEAQGMMHGMHEPSIRHETGAWGDGVIAYTRVRG